MTCTQTAFTGATGARPITALSRRIVRELEARAPAATDVERNRLYPILEGARVALGLGTPALQTLKHLIGFTRPDDWTLGRTPIAWPSNYTLAELAGVTESAIKARLRQLRTLGLVTAHDSAHGRRTGRRDVSGAITSAYGLDLSPLRIRFEELRTLADAQTAQSRLFKEGRQAIARSRRLIGQVLAQAADLQLTGAHWMALQDAIERIAARATAARVARDSAAYQAALDCLPQLEQDVGATIDRFMFTQKNSASGSKSAPDIHIQTNPSPHPYVQGDRDRSRHPDAGAPSEPLLPASPSGSVFKARPVDLVAMFPTLAMYMSAPTPGWPDLHAAAARLRHDLGIRTATWVDALDRIGRDGAAVAMMITAERQARHEIRQTPGAYFAGMVAKAGRDELDLGRSLWGFRHAVLADH
ncbi:replication initiation protein RepC [Sphingomonas sp. BE138]|uniref:plasmid replication protein RepC n=1 Tax=Sphingomonas sp. BE138 TaxID=2817845 RepID=UPI00285B1D93|nr:plasmid replication protein RepC [Sphingomonas sp. BE138]MDR6790711.1 replication initiation protein RepC [Sphingomonas sp. BE138]